MKNLLAALLLLPWIVFGSQGTHLSLTHVSSVGGQPPTSWDAYCGPVGFDRLAGEATYTSLLMLIDNLTVTVPNVSAGFTDGSFECLTRSCINGNLCSPESNRTAAILCGTAAGLPSGTCDDGGGATAPNTPGVPGVNFTFP